MDACDAYGQKTSSFLKEVQSLPLLQSALDLYTSTRISSRVLNTGLAVVEFTLSNVWGSMFTKTELASRIDVLAGDGMSKLKERYPALNKTPSEIKEGTSTSLKKTVRGMMQTTPGQAIIRGMDWAIDKSESILDRITPRHLSPRKRKVTRSRTKQAQIAKDHAYASEDSGACETEGATHTVPKIQHMVTAIEQSSSHRQFSGQLGLMDKFYRLTVVLPLQIFVQTLKSFRRYTGGKRKRQVLSPEKENEIDARRKISPKKKVQSSLLRKIRFGTYKLLGYHSAIPIDLGRIAGCKSPDRVDAEKKRKHDEILSDEGSDSDNDLGDFDYDNYESEEDPDYEPESSDDSADSDIDDAEEDLDANVDIECLCCTDTDVKQPDHGQFFQIKDQPNAAKLIVDNKQEKKKELPNETSMDKQDNEISLKPQWQTLSK